MSRVIVQQVGSVVLVNNVVVNGMEDVCRACGKLQCPSTCDVWVEAKRLFRNEPKPCTEYRVLEHALVLVDGGQNYWINMEGEVINHIPVVTDFFIDKPVEEMCYIKGYVFITEEALVVLKSLGVSPPKARNGYYDSFSLTESEMGNFSYKRGDAYNSGVICLKSQRAGGFYQDNNY